MNKKHIDDVFADTIDVLRERGLRTYADDMVKAKEDIWKYIAELEERLKGRTPVDIPPFSSDVSMSHKGAGTINAANGGKYFRGQYVKVRDKLGEEIEVEIIRAKSRIKNTNTPLYIVMNDDGVSWEIEEGEVVGVKKYKYIG